MTSQYHAQYKLTSYTSERSGLWQKIGLNQEMYQTIAGDFEDYNCEVLSRNVK